ncbi:AMP-forming long-chain acyl-CoA synthetase [Salinarchaeum sp. Harcht-Bsk1]|uniref:AMP-dependent synthetase/ligase n=1 Tax=Salinarchaeum sp. Harcht-Bsk1 TaxID=1333523 RepID=UPI0003423BB6|nr:long-chain fatty acid--CoA ligase [Salinarchaeum sp. Harcht-Bsk1]AGN02837.1 AMP-forming long-chain acyl-CoA synthetase [Salinarchaeum sp. Harcht-Bsk1]
MDRLETERSVSDRITTMTTLPVMLENTADEYSDRQAQGYKGGIYDRSLAPTAISAPPPDDYETLTYDEMRQVVRRLAAGFRSLGLAPDDRVGIFADTRLEWAQSDFAILAAGGVVTTVYESSSPDQVRYLLDDPGASGVVVENQQLLERVLEVEDDLALEWIVSMDELDDRYDERDDVYELVDVFERCREAFDEATYQSWLDERDPDDLASLVYTSGTTGQPKGVRLSHRNFRANVNQVHRRQGKRSDKHYSVPVIDRTTRTVSYLPLAHVFERLAGHFEIFAVGGTVCYAESPDTLRDDFGLFEPTTATSVPRVYEKMYDAIREQASESAAKKRIFDWATGVAREYHEADRPGLTTRGRYWLADKLVFSDVRDALGGNVEMLVSGGGTLSEELCTLYHGMGLPILEGYGLTEAAPVVTSNPAEEVKIGTIGPPLVDVDVKIDTSVVLDAEVTDVFGETGELLIKGPNVTDGYWNMPDATERAFTDDGYLRTGDIVTKRPDDYLTFHERSKQLLVLRTGKNVAPAPIEDAFVDSQIVEQAMVVGDDRKYVGALLVPNLDAIRSWAESNGEDLPADDQALCQHDVARERVQEEVDRINEGFEPHEQIGDFRLVPTEFTEENGLMTPTLKKRRSTIQERFESLIEDIYASDTTEANAPRTD